MKLLRLLIIFAVPAYLSLSVSSDSKNKISELLRERVRLHLDSSADPRLLRNWPSRVPPSVKLDETKVTSYELSSVILSSSENVRVNDPMLEEPPRVQSSTCSAVSGNNIVVAYNDIGTKYSAVSYSSDSGKTWRQTHIPSPPEGRNFGNGAVAASSSGTFYYVGMALASNNRTLVSLSRSSDGGRSWAEPKYVFPQNVVGVAQEKPWIAVDSATGLVYVAWTEIRSNGGSRIVLAVSRDEATTFQDVYALTQFDGSFSVQGAFLAVAPDSDIYVAWGDTRTRGIRFIRGTNGGRQFSQIFNVVSPKGYELLGPLLNGRFAANGLPSMAVDNSQSPTRGKIYLVYNGRSIERQEDKSDVFIVSSTDKGATWSAPRKVDSSTLATDQFMPSVAVDRNGAVAVMWYDRRNDPIYNSMIDVYAGVSTDGGISFNTRRISTGNWLLLPTPPGIRANYHGDYNQIAALSDTAGFVFAWGDDRSGQDADVYSAVYTTAALVQGGPDIIFSPAKPSQTVVAGQGAQLEVTLFKVGLSGKLEYAVSSDNIQLSLESFDEGSIERLRILARTTTTTKVGTHPVFVSATLGGITRTTTLRLNVLPPSAVGKVALNLSTTVGRSVHPHGAFDTNGRLHLVWSDDKSGNFNVYYARSSAVLGSLTSAIEISRTMANCINPQLAISSAVHVVWQECDSSGSCRIFYVKGDLEAGFAAPKLLSVGFEFAELPSIVVNGDNVLVFWDGVKSFSNIKFEVYAVRSTDGGASFGLPFLIESGGSRNLFTTAAASDGAGRTYLAYESCESGDCQIEVLRSQDDFKTFKHVGSASRGQFFSIKPSIVATADGQVHVAMTTALSSTDSRFEIFYSSSSDFGESFSAARNVSNTQEQSNNPSLVAFAGKLYLAWVDKTPGNSEIFLSESSDGGTTFSLAVNLSNNITVSQSPQLVAGLSELLLLLEDEIEGNEEIYAVRLDGQERAPQVSDLDPEVGPPGTVITVRGKELLSAVEVSIGGQAVQHFLVSYDTLSAIAGSKGGNLTVRNTSGQSAEPVEFKLSSKITVSPAVVDFGKGVTGERLRRTVWIRNLGQTALRISELQLEGSDFIFDALPTLPTSVSPGGTLPLQLVFLPTSTLAEGSLKITSDDSAQPVVRVRLRGETTGVALRLKSPSGGERLKAGQLYVIQWEAEGDMTYDLSLSVDGGKTFTAIVSGLPSFSRSFTWTVPSVKTNAARVQVVGRTSDGRVFIDQSRANFRIKKK